MCTVMVYTGRDMSVDTFGKAFAATRSRGPDGERIITLPRGGIMGFQRLSIMGLTASGMQPFELDGNYAVCNGELYGFRPVKAELERKGYRFASDSDCEIILPLYKEYGTDMFARLDAEYAMVYSDVIEDKIDQIIPALRARYPGLDNLRWHAIKLLEGDQEITRKYPVDLPAVLDRSYESDIINQKYDFIGEIIDEVLIHKERQDELTERADRLLTDKVWGIPVFLGIMAVIFFLTFTVGDWLKGYLELAIGWLSDGAAAGLAAIQAGDVLTGLIVDGIIAGVGTIVTFLPNILILFLCLALLEDSGYMARVAYVMEGVMSRLGLSGKAFIPMLLGFGCTVPAIMASRALENKHDRLKVMLVTPFMSCNARLTIYILFSEMFFAEHAMVVAYAMYLIGIVVAILVMALLHLWDRKKQVNYLLIELPEYKLPDGRTVAIYVWEKVKDYLLNFGPGGYTADMTASFGALAGRVLTPFFAPIGLGYWQIAVALIAGISAKEVVVSSCAVLFGIVNASSPAGMAAFAAALEGIGFGPFNALCLMIFCLLYIPCAAALGTIQKESGSWGWMFFTAAFQLGVAWLVTFLVYQAGMLL